MEESPQNTPEKSKQDSSKNPVVVATVVGLVLLIIGLIAFIGMKLGGGGTSSGDSDDNSFVSFLPIWVAVFLPMWASKNKEKSKLTPQQQKLVIAALVISLVAGVASFFAFMFL